MTTRQAKSAARLRAERGSIRVNISAPPPELMARWHEIVADQGSPKKALLWLLNQKEATAKALADMARAMGA
jgi:hypothetical protein